MNFVAQEIVYCHGILGQCFISNKLKHPTFRFQRFTAFFHNPFLVGRAGLEPTTLCLKGRYSTS